MKQFITGPEPDNKVINLKEVSNIAFEEYTDRNGNDTWKIIYNFCFPISLKNNTSKKVPDYQYMVFHDKKEYDRTVDILNELVNQKNWLAPNVSGTIKRIINPDAISFVATDHRKNRVIVNLSTSVSFWNELSRMTSDFVYFDFDTFEDFTAEHSYILDQLNSREL